jgi:hypothetical protein
MPAKLTKNEVIAKIIEKHSPTAFNFDKFVYKNTNEKCIIGCNSCNEDFLATPSSLKGGHGCPPCGAKKAVSRRTFTKDQIILKIIEVQGIFPFDLSKVIYKSMNEKINIVCSFCKKDIWVLPGNLINGHGCQMCSAAKAGQNKKYTLEEIIELIIKKHGLFKFDFTNSVLIAANKKMLIHCNMCSNDIWLKPTVVIRGTGCIHCSRAAHKEKLRFTLEEALNKIIEKHGIEAFNFDNFTEYKNNSTPIIIGCNRCKEDFSITPASLFAGHGCEDCSYIDRRTNKNDFILESKEKFGNKFDYTFTNYTIERNKVIIKCNDCNDIFDVRAASHLHNIYGGCQTCYEKDAGRHLLKTQEQFLVEAYAVHKNKYDYSLSIYIGGKNSIIIKCNTCNDLFQQRASIHLEGHNCPLCGSKYISKAENQWLDELGISTLYRQKWLKIGKRKISTDAYDPNTNTVYEFYGDYWHGNPIVFDPNDINHRKNPKKTFGELYHKTIEREELILSADYKLITIWEHDWKQIKKAEKIRLKEQMGLEKSLQEKAA